MSADREDTGASTPGTEWLEQGRLALRIARWEVTSGAVGLDRRVLGALLLCVIAAGAVGGAVAVAGTPHDAGVYGVAVDESSPYHDAIAADHRLRAVRPTDTRAADVEVHIVDGVVTAVDTRTGRAAAAAVRTAVEQYNERLMDREAREGNATAAFPVTVQLEYVDRAALLGEGGAAESTVEGTPTVADGTGSSTDASGDRTRTPTSSPTARPASGANGGSGFGLPSIGAETLFGSSGGSPGDIQPPFPFSSLVLAFAFVVPMNFVVQVYASSVFRERINRRGELTLVAPVAPSAIVAGKTLPYLVAMVGIAALTAIGLGGGLVSIAAVVPIALLFLSSSFVGALFARSHKELTFVLVTVSVVVTTFVFVPAVFTDVHPIAAISPLTMVVRELEGVTIAGGTFLFATVPMTVASAVLFGLGGGVYREEDLFAQRPIPEKLLDALAQPLAGARSVGLLTIALVPFVVLAELLAVATLFVLPREVSLVALFVLIAGIEEVGKSLHVLAGFERGRFDRTIRSAVVVGLASGFGFFLAEKAVAVTQVVGLSRVEEGRVAFDVLAGTGGSSAPILLATLLLAPLLLHAVTAVISSVGAMQSRTRYAFGLSLAILLHTAYNVTVVMAIVR